MINRTVLMSDTRHFSTEQAINPYYGDTPPDLSLAAKEHEGIKAALQAAGITVITEPSAPNSQDGVYTANQALVLGNVAILARLPEVRRSEEPHAEAILQKLGKQVLHAPEGLRFSGQGDALVCGSYLFAGQGYRSDAAAQSFAAETLDLELVQLQTIPKLDSSGEPTVNAVSGWPDSDFYDIDLALAPIYPPSSNKKGLIAFCPEAFDDASVTILRNLGDFELIEVSLKEATEAFALNLVSTGESVVMSAHAPEFTAALQERGLRILTPEVRELAKGGGYIRCVTLTLD
jgi:N-dimethylarginine dimethylaminohydrolase